MKLLIYALSLIILLNQNPVKDQTVKLNLSRQKGGYSEIVKQFKDIDKIITFNENGPDKNVPESRSISILNPWELKQEHVIQIDLPYIQYVAICENGKSLLIKGEKTWSSHLRKVDVSTGKIIRESREIGSCSDLLVDNQREYFYTAAISSSADLKVNKYRIKDFTKEKAGSVSDKYKRQISSFVISDDGKTICVLSMDMDTMLNPPGEPFFILDVLDTGGMVLKATYYVEGRITDIAFCSNSRVCCLYNPSKGGNDSIALISLTDGKTMKKIPLQKNVYENMFFDTVSNRLIVTTCFDNWYAPAKAFTTVIDFKDYSTRTIEHNLNKVSDSSIKAKTNQSGPGATFKNGKCRVYFDEIRCVMDGYNWIESEAYMHYVDVY
jgi:hypothetical protein